MKRLFLFFAFLGAAVTAQAATILNTEKATFVRFEQYTGALVLWRLPTPGVSTFPSSTCLNLQFAPSVTVEPSRFMAIYMFAQSNDKNYFIQYDPATCKIVSFGMDG